MLLLATRSFVFQSRTIVSGGQVSMGIGMGGSNVIMSRRIPSIVPGAFPPSYAPVLSNSPLQMGQGIHGTGGRVGGGGGGGGAEGSSSSSSAQFNTSQANERGSYLSIYQSSRTAYIRPSYLTHLLTSIFMVFIDYCNFLDMTVNLTS